MRLPYALFSITGFFLYEPPDRASGIRHRALNGSSHRMAIHTIYADDV